MGQTERVALTHKHWMCCVLGCISRVQLFATLWTVAFPAPLSIGFSRQEYWSGCPCPPPGDLPDAEIKTVSLCLLHWQAGSLPLASPGKPQINQYSILKNKSVGMQFRAGMDCHLHKVHSHPDTGFLLVHRFAVSQV